MIKPINATDSTSSKRNTIIKSSALGAAGATVGGVTAYALQKRAIKAADAAKEAAKNKNIFQKITGAITGGIKYVFNKTVDTAKTVKSKYATTMQEIGNSGKISKMGIAKAAAAVGLAFPAIYLAKQALSAKPKTQEDDMDI